MITRAAEALDKMREIGADREFAGPSADRTTFEDLSAMLIADW